MQITISDKAIATAVGYALDGSVYEYFDTATIKAAGVPKRAEAIKAVMADAKFQAKMAKKIAQCAEDGDMLADFVYDIDPVSIYKLVNDCEAVYDKVAEARRKEQQKKDTARMIEILKEQGYKITK